MSVQLMRFPGAVRQETVGTAPTPAVAGGGDADHARPCAATPNSIPTPSRPPPGGGSMSTRLEREMYNTASHGARGTLPAAVESDDVARSPSHSSSVADADPAVACNAGPEASPGMSGSAPRTARRAQDAHREALSAAHDMDGPRAACSAPKRLSSGHALSHMIATLSASTARSWPTMVRRSRIAVDASPRFGVAEGPSQDDVRASPSTTTDANRAACAPAAGKANNATRRWCASRTNVCSTGARGGG